MEAGAAQKRGSAIIKPNKRLSLLKNQNAKGDNSSSKVHLDSSKKGTIEEEKEEGLLSHHPFLKDSTHHSDPLPPDDDTQRKKRKRIVDSRDAWTQTDRSDYMLIKYR